MEAAQPFDIDAALAGIVRRWWSDESGVTAIEYGLLAALIAVTCVGAFTLTGGSLGDVYDYWTGAVLAALGK